MQFKVGFRSSVHNTAFPLQTQKYSHIPVKLLTKVTPRKTTKRSCTQHADSIVKDTETLKPGHKLAREINITISNADNLDQLWSVLSSNWQYLDFINISNSFNVLPSINSKHKKQFRRDSAKLNQIVDFLVKYYLDNYMQFGPQQVANMVQGLGKVGWRPTNEWSSQVLQQLKTDVPYFSTLECARVLHGMTGLKGLTVVKGQQSQLSPEWLPVARETLQQYCSLPQDFSLPCTATQVVWALGKLNLQPSQESFNVLVKSLDSEISKGKEQDWCIALYGLACLKITKHDQRAQQIVQRLIRYITTGIKFRWKYYNVGRLAIVAWSMAKLEKGDGPLVQQIVQHGLTQKQHFGCAEIQILLWSISYLIWNRIVLNNVVISQLFFDLQEVVQSKAPEFWPQALSNVLQAYARMRLGDASMMAALYSQIHRKVYQFNLSEICGILWALGEIWLYNFSLFDEKLMLQLVTQVRRNTDGLGILEIDSLAKSMANAQHFDLHLFNSLFTKLRTLRSQLLLKNSVSIFRSFVYLSYVNSTVVQFFIEHLQQFTDVKDWSIWCVTNTLWSLSILGCHDTHLFSLMLNFINQFEIHNFSIEALSQIYESYLMTYGDQWQIVDYQVMNTAEQIWKERVIEQRERPLSDTQKQLQYQVLGMLLPGVKCQSIIGDGRYCADIAIKIGDRQIVMDVGGGYMYSRIPPYRELGPVVAKRIILNALGWEFLIVPFYEWYKLQSKDAQTKYLKNKVYDIQDDSEVIQDGELSQQIEF